MLWEVVHFSHWHYLRLDQQKRKEEDQVTCNGCTNKISGDFYGCYRCEHYVCKSCVGLAPEIQHPFHTKHPLTLLPQSPYKNEGSRDFDRPSPVDEAAYCSACGMRCDGFIFHCSECKSPYKFDLHVNCATLMPTTTTTTTTTTTNYNASERQTTHVYKGSEHPLIPCYRKNKQLDFLCSVCNQHIKGTIYVCLYCEAIMDESCIQLPLQIAHHFHPHHTLSLTLTRRRHYNDCGACGDSKDRFCYNCNNCFGFALDVKCASLMPKAIIENDDDHQVVEAPFTHPHDLIPCDITKGIFSFSCSACGLCIEGTLYVCLQCNFLLHKSCAELPLQIKHPFHPQHPLVLEYTNSSVNYRCKACKCSVLGFQYLCGECDFEMDVTCASLTYSTLKFEIHKHPLAIFNGSTFTKRKMDCSVNCNSCEIFKGFPFFRCVPCDFSIKLCCLTMLPHKFKHSNHRHSLTLTYSFIRDHSDDNDYSEYYCDVCEELRNLWEPTYYCEDCHYVAHTSCVFDEILFLLGMEWPLALDEEIVMLQTKIDALSVKIGTLTSTLEEIKERRAQHINRYETWINEEGETMDYDAQMHCRRIMYKHDTAILHAKISKHEKEVYTLTNKLKTLTTKLDELKEGHPKHIGGYQIGSIPSLGRKSSVTILDVSNEVVEEDCSMESMKKDEDEDVGTKSSVTNIDDPNDQVVEEDCNVESTKKDEDEDSDGTFPTLAEVDQEIEATTKKLEATTKRLEALKTKRVRRVSFLEFKG